MEPITENSKIQISDLLKEKISLIEDIFKVKRLLYGFGFNQHIDAIFYPEEVFDVLYELDIEALEVKLSTYHAEASKKARELAGF